MADHRPDIYRENDKWIFRASSLAMCSKRLVASGLGHAPLPVPDALMRGFEEGAANEDRVLDMFEQGHGLEGPWASRYAGLELPKWTRLRPDDPASYLVRKGRGDENDGSTYPHCRLEYLNDGQFTVEWEVVPGCVVRGHMDGVAECYESRERLADGLEGLVGTRVVEEAKLFGPDYWKKWLREGFAGFATYAMQVSVYGHATGLDVAFIVGQKIRGEEGEEVAIPSAHVTWVPNDALPVSRGQIMARVLKLRALVEAGDLGECDADSTWGCPVAYLGCGDGGNGKEELPRHEVEDGDGFADLVAECQAAKANSKMAKTREDEVKAKLVAMMGDPAEKGVWSGGGREVEWVVEERKAYEVKASTRMYPRVKKVKMKDDDENGEG